MQITPKPYSVILNPNTSRSFHAADFADKMAAMTYCAMLEVHLSINADVFVTRNGKLVPWNEVTGL